MTIVNHWKVHASQVPSFLSFQLKEEKKKHINYGLFQFEKLGISKSILCFMGTFVTPRIPSFADETDPVDLNRPWKVY